MRNVVLYGGSFNPPCSHHREVVQAIARNPIFGEIVVIPCGRRSDKSYISNHFRMLMVEYTFDNISRVVLDFRNLKNDTFTSNHHLETLYRGPNTLLWHAIGSDLLVRNDGDLNTIQRRWTEGASVWRNFNFLIIPRKGYPIVRKFLPKRNLILQHEFSGSSTEVLAAIRNGAPFKHLVDTKTYELIVSENLYR